MKVSLEMEDIVEVSLFCLIDDILVAHEIAGGGGGRGGGGGGGGGREGDWLCASCGNTNFARRNSWLVAIL